LKRSAASPRRQRRCGLDAAGQVAGAHRSRRRPRGSLHRDGRCRRIPRSAGSVAWVLPLPHGRL